MHKIRGMTERSAAALLQKVTEEVNRSPSCDLPSVT